MPEHPDSKHQDGGRRRIERGYNTCQLFIVDCSWMWLYDISACIPLIDLYIPHHRGVFPSSSFPYLTCPSLTVLISFLIFINVTHTPNSSSLFNCKLLQGRNHFISYLYTPNSCSIGNVSGQYF